MPKAFVRAPNGSAALKSVFKQAPRARPPRSPLRGPSPTAASRVIFREKGALAASEFIRV